MLSSTYLITAFLKSLLYIYLCGLQKKRKRKFVYVLQRNGVSYAACRLSASFQENSLWLYLFYFIDYNIFWMLGSISGIKIYQWSQGESQ